MKAPSKVEEILTVQEKVSAYMEITTSNDTSFFFFAKNPSGRFISAQKKETRNRFGTFHVT
jgi:hypothetical protein